MTEHGDTVAGPTWLRAVGFALLFVYPPQLAAFVFSALPECDHCVGMFWVLYPVVPGLVPATAFGREAGGDFVVGLAGAFALALLVGASLLARHSGRGWRFVAGVLAVLSAANATVVGNLLRA